jgi:hypothetical protein
VFLFEHASRVALNAQRLARLPEFSSTDLDPTALLVAALYHDASWVTRCKDGELDRMEVLLSSVAESAWDGSVAAMERGLSKLLPGPVLRRAASAIRSLSRHGNDSAEGRVVSEANSLDEFGLPALWGMIRRGMLDGRGVQAVLEMWQRKREYQFWTARLRDSFQVPAVRRLAEQRLQTFERFMEELAQQQAGSDTERACAGSNTREQARTT